MVDITKESAAEKAGLEPGDVINKIDNETVKNVAHLKYLLYKHKIGDTIKISYIRGKKEKTVELKLTARIDD